MGKLVLIDGNSILYRAFYATPYFATKEGVQTNAVYGFLNMLLKVIAEIKPDHMLVAFDRKEPTYRHNLFNGYKATRKPMPDGLVPQVQLIKDVLGALGIQTYEQAGLEADDIIGIAAKKFLIPTIIITGDKDSFQLVDETTSVYLTRKGISEYEIYTADNFKEKVGIDPIQIIDLKACMGDSSDNIPGIPGIGEKTALTLIQNYGDIENLYLHIDDLKGKMQEKVIGGKDSAFLSKQLATISIDQSIPLEIDDLKFAFPFNRAARKILSQLEFISILKKDIFEQGSLNPDESDNEKEKTEKKLINKVILKDITTDKIKFDAPSYSVIFGEKINFSDGQTEWEISIKESFFDSGFSFDEALNYLSFLFDESNKKQVILFDKKSTNYLLKPYSIKLSNNVEDVMLQKYVIDYTQREMTIFEVLERHGLDLDAPACSLFNLYKIFDQKIKEAGLEGLYRDIELPLCDVLFDMEQAGFKIDVAALDEASVSYHKRIDGLLAKIKSLAGCDFNPNSPKQLGEVLFERLGLKHGKKNKSGYSTNAETLEELEGSHPIISLILQYRQLQKLLSTYVDGFRPLIDKNTGLIHTVFNQTITSTGRLSSKEPNLQNIPVREEEGRLLRKFFIARGENRRLIGADYSQIELRLLAHYSNCKPLIEAFNNNEDIHSLTASQVFNTPLSDVTAEQRRSAKAVNFGIIYGISEYGLAKNLKISPRLASEYINAYFKMYPSVKEYMQQNVAFAQENGYICTAFGRKRVIPEIKSSNYNVRSFGERAAMNMPLQGTAADIIKIAMINVYNRLNAEVPSARLILQVHDELIIDADESDVYAVSLILEEEMKNAAKLSVPLTVNVSNGLNWYEAK